MGQIATLEFAGQTTTARPPGRPTVCSATLLESIFLLIRRDGLSDSAAAAKCGLSPSTLSRWKQSHPGLAVRLSATREEFREAQLAILRSAKKKDGSPDWRAAAWLLERIFPEDYSRTRTPKRPEPIADCLVAADESLEELAEQIDCTEIEYLASEAEAAQAEVNSYARIARGPSNSLRIPHAAGDTFAKHHQLVA